MPTFDYPTWIISLFLAPFGLVLGSFANVLIHRLPQEDPAERNVVTVPSHCPGCKARIRPWHNVPLVSWLWLRGRCAQCGWRIPVRYPLVELLGGDKVHIPKRPGEPDCTWADITKLTTELGWAPEVPFEEGVRRIVANIDYWREAPLWDPGSIAKATETWFKYLG